MLEASPFSRRQINYRLAGRRAVHKLNVTSPAQYTVTSCGVCSRPDWRIMSVTSCMRSGWPFMHHASLNLSVRPSVCPSVCLSVPPLIRHFIRLGAEVRSLGWRHPSSSKECRTCAVYFISGHVTGGEWLWDMPAGGGGNSRTVDRVKAFLNSCWIIQLKLIVKQFSRT